MITQLKYTRMPVSRHFRVCVAVLFAASLSAAAYSQSAVQGEVLGSTGQSLAKANIFLLHSADSSLVKGIASAENGAFEFRDISAGKYFVTVSHTGYKQWNSEAFVLSPRQAVNLGKINLAEAPLEMNALTVVGRKSLFEQKPDRLVINVQNSASSAGSSALEVLERSPGVIVNRQNSTISMSGKEGVMLMINGKISYMPAEALIEMLNGMSSGSIEKIELITTPPANLDAEGHAGYINIILKSNNSDGTNGSFTATLGTAHGPLTETNLNLNIRKDKLNIFGNLSFSYVQKPLPINSSSSINKDGVNRSTNFAADRIETVINFNGRVGLDYQLTRKTLVGVLVSGYDNDYRQKENNRNEILKNGILDTLELQDNHEVNHWQNIGGNLSVQQEFSKDAKLIANLDYIYYVNNQPYYYSSSFYTPDGEFIYTENTQSIKYTPITLWVGALDYSHKLGKIFTIDAGLKRTIADFSNHLDVSKSRQGPFILDSALSAQQQLLENYTAGYVSTDLNLGVKDHLKFGLRYEYTNSNLDAAEKKDLVDRHYGNFFPVLTYNHTLNEKAAFSISYNSRIGRPSFNQLAPFTYFINGTTSITGNPALQPAISHTVMLNYSFQKYIFSLSLTRENHAIGPFQPRVDSVAGKIIVTPENLDYQNLATLTATVPLQVAKWWSMLYSVTGTYQEVKGGPSNGLSLSQMNVGLNGVETFRFAKTYTVEVSGFYQSPRYSGINLQKGYGSLDLGIKKKLAGRGGTLSFSASNLLLSQDFVLTTRYHELNLDSYLRVRFNQRAFKLTYTRSFGNDKVKERRDRNTGAEDEKARVQ